MDWNLHLQPLFKKYGNRQHPLEYKNNYQLVVMIVLSAQTTDAMVNRLAAELFRIFPDMKSLASIKPEKLYPYIKSVRGFRKKAEWLVKIAQALADCEDIPLSIEELTKLPGIGRKSANVIIREAGGSPQGIFMDLHVLRVVPRIGITQELKPEKVEKALMEIIPKDHWHAAGMSLSYLGRELCRPSDPECSSCLLKEICRYNLHNF
ncbi:MAG: endonuclease III [Bacteroidetes bacterium]|nr:endonuclease III [Bacteroidota bacterium]